MSVEVDESPICGCGRGKDLGAFTKKPSWKVLPPFFTRIVLGPLFSTSFMGGLLDPEPQQGSKLFTKIPFDENDLAKTFLVKINCAREWQTIFSFWQARKPKALDVCQRVQDDGVLLCILPKSTLEKA